MRLLIMKQLYSRSNLRSTLRGKLPRATLPKSYKVLASKMFSGIAYYQLTKCELEDISAAVIKQEEEAATNSQ